MDIDSGDFSKVFEHLSLQLAVERTRAVAMVR